MVAQGKHPRDGGVPTFETATDEGDRGCIRQGLEGREPYRGRLAERVQPNHLYPALGAKRIDKITTANLLDVLGPICARDSLARLICCAGGSVR